MNRKNLLISLTLALALTLLIVGVAMAAGKADTNAPDCYNSITTKKVTVPGGGQDFDFTLKRGSSVIDTFSLDDQQTHQKTTNAWANFYLIEAEKDGYRYFLRLYCYPGISCLRLRSGKSQSKDRH